MINRWQVAIFYPHYDFAPRRQQFKDAKGLQDFRNAQKCGIYQSVPRSLPQLSTHFSHPRSHGHCHLINSPPDGNLSQDDRTVITKHPLDDSRSSRDSLRKAEQSDGPNSITHNGAGDTRGWEPLKAVSRLLYIL